MKLAALEIEIGANVKAAIAGLDKVTDEVKAFADGTKVNLKSAAAAFNVLKVAQENATNTADLKKYNTALAEINNTSKQLKGIGIGSQMDTQLAKTTQTTFAFNQVLREAPAFAYSFQTGLLGISNNLPILSDQFKAAKAAGASNVDIFKQLAGALVSPINLIGIGIALLPTLSKLFTDNSEAAKKAKESFDGFLDSSAKEGLKAKELLGFASDQTRSLEQRKLAVDELRSSYPTYLKGLSDEKILSGDLGDAYERINEQLRNKVLLQAAEEKIIPIIKQQIELQLKNIELQKEVSAAIGITQKEIDRGNKVGINTAGILAAKSAGARIEIEKNTAAIKEYEKRINSSFQSVSKLFNATKVFTPKAEAKAKALPKEKEVKLPKVSKELLFEDAAKPTIQLFPKINLDKANIKAQILEKIGNLGIPITFDPTASSQSLQELLDGVIAKYNGIKDFVSNALTAPFDAFFTTLIDGSGNAFESFGRALSGIIKKLIVTTAVALGLAAVFSLIGLPVIGAGGKGLTGFKDIFKFFRGQSGLPFANGGIVTGPTNALIGERGPEAVIPLDRFSALASSMGGGGGNSFQLIPVWRGSDLFMAVEKSKQVAFRNNG